jgi:predicted small lipoprotein YifL
VTRRAIGGAFIVLAVALTLAGCGRSGALEPPPGSAQEAAVATPARPLSVEERRQVRREEAIAEERRRAENERKRAEDPYGEDWPYPPREKVIDVDPQGSRPSTKPPEKRFFLDPLLN